MHIVFVAQFAGSIKHGMVYGHYYLAKEWVREGHKVTIIAGTPSHNRVSEPGGDEAVTEEIIDGIRYLWLRSFPYKQNQWIRRILNILSFTLYARFRRLPIESADVVVCSSHQTLAILAAEHLARRYGSKLVFEVRDLWPLSLLEMSNVSRWNPFIMMLQWAEDRAYRKADAVVSVLPNAREYMVGRGLDAKKFNYIPNGVSLNEESSMQRLPEGHLSQLNKSDSTDFFIGYAGNIGYANALDVVVQSLSQLPENVKFFVMGQGAGVDRLIAEADSCNVTDRVVILPPVKKPQVYNFLEKMDALYIGLQHKEIFRFGVSPTKINDYLLAKKPVICAINVGHEAISEGKAGVICDPSDPSSIADAVIQLKNMSKADRATMGELGFHWLRNNRDYKKLANEFIRVLNSA